MVLFLALGMEGALALPEVCTQCPGSLQNLSKVAFYCKESPNLTVQARCCTNQKGTILGLDLQNCSLKDPGPNFPQAYTAVIMVLPQAVNCPGGHNAWEHVSSDINYKICQGQKNHCNSTREPEMCPENGSCLPDGPGLSKCICSDGFHGYKCTRQGSFPLLMFFGILGSTTLSISLLLWGTQRRKAKTS
ncbi:Apoptosis-related protein 3 [Heterocephalus glaber]|uniref:Apoptosis-related protein 3 n=1 Tax=Heterocephalus glaber TaxID=10181 RepID=G5BYZ8_HETGA|nr:Apoptosis-related protein 3 [Heterocephalus glaber]